LKENAFYNRMIAGILSKSIDIQELKIKIVIRQRFPISDAMIKLKATPNDVF
jgi:hypothetical protein